jgi:hypothetical protein
MEETAEQVASMHSALLLLANDRQPVGLIWRLWHERPVGTVAVVLPNLDAEDLLQMASAHDQQPVQALGADRPHPALGGRVRPGACTGVKSTSAPSERNTSSKLRRNVASRSCSSKRTCRLRSPAPATGREPAG